MFAWVLGKVWSYKKYSAEASNSDIRHVPGWLDQSIYHLFLAEQLRVRVFNKDGHLGFGLTTGGGTPSILNFVLTCFEISHSNILMKTDVLTLFLKVWWVWTPQLVLSNILNKNIITTDILIFQVFGSSSFYKHLWMPFWIVFLVKQEEKDNYKTKK